MERGMWHPSTTTSYEESMMMTLVSVEVIEEEKG
jgi:hypothetical protein